MMRVFSPLLGIGVLTLNLLFIAWQRQHWCRHCLWLAACWVHPCCTSTNSAVGRRSPGKQGWSGDSRITGDALSLGTQPWSSLSIFSQEAIHGDLQGSQVPPLLPPLSLSGLVFQLQTDFLSQFSSYILVHHSGSSGLWSASSHQLSWEFIEFESTGWGEDKLLWSWHVIFPLGAGSLFPSPPALSLSLPFSLSTCKWNLQFTAGLSTPHQQPSALV